MYAISIHQPANEPWESVWLAKTSSAHCHLASFKLSWTFFSIYPHAGNQNTACVQLSQTHTWSGGSPAESRRFTVCWLSLIYSATVGSGHMGFRGNWLCWQLLLKAFAINLPQHPSLLQHQTHSVKKLTKTTASNVNTPKCASAVMVEFNLWRTTAGLSP